MQDTLQPKADQIAEEGIKPAGKAAKDAVKQAQDQIPDPDQSRKVAEEQVSKVAKPAAQAVKDNAQPAADKVPFSFPANLRTPKSHALKTLPSLVRRHFHRSNAPKTDGPFPGPQ